MHWTTYERLIDELWEAEALSASPTRGGEQDPAGDTWDVGELFLLAQRPRGSSAAGLRARQSRRDQRVAARLNRARPDGPLATALLRRQMQIALDRETEMMSWEGIASKHHMPEDDVRAAYDEYIDQIVPLIYAEKPPEKAVEFLLQLDAMEEHYRALANSTTNPHVELKALSGIVDIIGRKVELSCHLGLMPTRMAALQPLKEPRHVFEALADICVQLGASPEQLQEIGDLLTGRADLASSSFVATAE
jgi:hypothetical protein